MGLSVLQLFGLLQRCPQIVTRGSYLYNEVNKTHPLRIDVGIKQDYVH